jgi:predicted small metal-binding protein
MWHFISFVLITLSCRETGLDCDYVIEGKTEEEILIKGADHAIKVHGLKTKEIFFKAIPCNFLCHTLDKLTSNKNA